MCSAWRSLFLIFSLSGSACSSMGQQGGPHLQCHPVPPEDEVIYRNIAQNLFFDKKIALDSVQYLEATECEGEDEVSVIFVPNFQAGVLMITINKKSLKATLELEG